VHVVAKKNQNLNVKLLSEVMRCWDLLLCTLYIRTYAILTAASQVTFFYLDSKLLQAVLSLSRDASSNTSALRVFYDFHVNSLS